jgi:hypothetical protein
MIGTEVLFDVKVTNPLTYNEDWVRKTGIIRDKIRRSQDHSPQIIDYYLIESNQTYYFIVCDKIMFKK